MIPMSELKDRQAYWGECRNASLAVWFAENQRFVYMRTKFSSAYFETIQHIEDPELPSNIDGFVPSEEASREEVIIDFGKKELGGLVDYMYQQLPEEKETK